MFEGRCPGGLSFLKVFPRTAELLSRWTLRQRFSEVKTAMDWRAANCGIQFGRRQSPAAHNRLMGSCMRLAFRGSLCHKSNPPHHNKLNGVLMRDDKH